MDDIVKQALAKWPNVPDCYGWLGLDARGRWYMRDAAVQAAGSFAKAKGAMLLHEKLIDFIGRNYEPDALGQWFFQNGPQRVYVELEFTPWVWRVQLDYAVLSHTGRSAVVQDCLMDEQGRIYFATDLGLGLVHTQDVLLVAQAVEAGRWIPCDVQAQDLSTQFGYVMHPHDAHKWRDLPESTLQP